MDAYLHEGEFYCEACAPKNSEAYSDGGGESDTPQHCNECGIPLENPLTSEGVEYVLEQAEHECSRSAEERNRIMPLAGTAEETMRYWHGSRHCEIVLGWLRQLDDYFLKEDQELRRQKCIEILEEDVKKNPIHQNFKTLDECDCPDCVQRREKEGGIKENPSFNIGDKVKYKASFLRSIGQYTGDMLRATGIVKRLVPMGSSTLVEIDWGGIELPSKVLDKNLIKAERVMFDENPKEKYKKIYIDIDGGNYVVYIEIEGKKYYLEKTRSFEGAKFVAKQSLERGGRIIFVEPVKDYTTSDENPSKEWHRERYMDYAKKQGLSKEFDADYYMTEGRKREAQAAMMAVNPQSISVCNCCADIIQRVNKVPFTYITGFCGSEHKCDRCGRIAELAIIKIDKGFDRRRKKNPEYKERLLGSTVYYKGIEAQVVDWAEDEETSCPLLLLRFKEPYKGKYQIWVKRDSVKQNPRVVISKSARIAEIRRVLKQRKRLGRRR